MPLLDHMAWFGSKFNLFLVYVVPFDWKFNGSHSSHSPLETTFSLKPTGMWSVSPARWVIKVTSSISWRTSRFLFTVDALVKKQSHSMRVTRHAYCLPALWNGAVSVQDVVNPTSDPWLVTLWVNQGGIFCWNRMGDIQLSLILPLQSSAFSNKECPVNPPATMTKDRFVFVDMSHLWRLSGLLTSSSYSVGWSSRVPERQENVQSVASFLFVMH